MKGSISSLLWRSLRVHQVFGANTDVGKTIFTTLLCKTAKQKGSNERVSYLKPVSTGATDDADDKCELLPQSCTRFNVDESRRIRENATEGVISKTLFQYDKAVSPHMAARASKQSIPSDDVLLLQCRKFAAEHAAQGPGWLFVETAGGIHSPGPSGSTQADIYTPLRMPVVLIGDSRLGGISSTISAFESLLLRGYSVESVLLFRDNKYENYRYLSEYFDKHHDIPLMSMPEPPERIDDERQDIEAMSEYYTDEDCKDMAGQVLAHLDRRHNERIASIQSLSDKAHQHIWYPFTQQKLLQLRDIAVIDSAHGDYFQTLTPTTSAADPLLRSSFDGSASWWTQGLGHANPQLTLAAAQAAGRYGHVMFAGAVHEPAVSLTQALLAGMQNPRLNRVFFSDNGSTGTEVAVKMGLRAARVRYGWDVTQPLGVLGLKGGYHGDTIGAMDMSEPCEFNEKVEWYEGKGFWFDYPTVLCSQGRWTVTVDDELARDVGQGGVYGSLSEIFDLEKREQRGEHLRYEKYIHDTLVALQREGRKFGSLVIEPVVLGAGGMKLVDPLFQRTLVNVVRRSQHLFSTNERAAPRDEKDWSGLPVIFDEVFTGLYRLGRFTPSLFLGVCPDISVHAKLLTGGLIPLSTTLASEHIFDTFGSEDKTDALLHGHSYTAHPIGCQVAVASLKEMRAMEQRGDWEWAKTQGWVNSRNTALGNSNHDLVWSMWPRQFVEELSESTQQVAGIWALGSVLSIHLHDSTGTGYSSNAAQSLRESLAKGSNSGVDGPWNVHSRVLGNVLYLMTSQMTSERGMQQIVGLLREILQQTDAPRS